jgi:nitroimidazol reductase NimA-like FMN-containing flavoprotein (pyridoxamine 5'-phosphate oxidase superfamily)
MLIHEMTRQEAIQFVAQTPLGRLACCLAGRPSVLPLFFALDGTSLFSFSSLGRKIAWMRQNPLVCVEFERIENPQNWETVIVGGRFEELNEASQPGLQERAYRALQARPGWWEPGYATTEGLKAKRSSDPIYFRIVIDEVTGRRCRPETAQQPRSPQSWRHLFTSAALF